MAIILVFLFILKKILRICSIESITSKRTSYNYEEQDVDFESVDQIDANSPI